MNTKNYRIAFLLLMGISLLSGCLSTTPATKQLSTQVATSLSAAKVAYVSDLGEGMKFAADVEDLAKRASTKLKKYDEAVEALAEQNTQLQLERLKSISLEEYSKLSLVKLAMFDETFETYYMSKIQVVLDRLTNEYDTLNQRLSSEPDSVLLYKQASAAAFKMLSLQREILTDRVTSFEDFSKELNRGQATLERQIDQQIASFRKSQSVAPDVNRNPFDIANAIIKEEGAETRAPEIAEKFRKRREEVSAAFDGLIQAYSHIDHVIQTDNERREVFKAFFEGATGSLIGLVTGGLENLSGKISEKVLEVSSSSELLQPFATPIAEKIKEFTEFAKAKVEEVGGELPAKLSDKVDNTIRRAEEKMN